jgi:hypothetical protein
MPTPPSTVAERLSWMMTSWKSVELRGRLEYTRGGLEESDAPAPRGVAPEVSSGQPLFDSYEQTIHYIETARGQRFYDETLVEVRPNADVRSQSIFYADGTRCASLFRRLGDRATRDQVQIKRHFALEASGKSYRPDPLNSLYVGTRPLHEAMAEATPLGTDRCLDRPCDVFLFSGVRQNSGKVDYVYHLDTSTSIPLKVVMYADEVARREERPTWVWSARTFEETGRLPLPRESETVAYQAVAPRPDAVAYRMRIHVEEMAFDREYASTLFWPEITEKTAVADFIKNKMTFPKSPPATAVGTGVPLRAEEPGGFPTTRVGVGLGLLILAVAVLLWYRRA